MRRATAWWRASRAAPADPLVLDPASRFDLKWPAAGGGRQGFITQPYANHNGGHLAFGPDGYLYIGMGDGGAGDDPPNNAQTPGTLLGKMLRIDVSVANSDTIGYAIPPGQPTFGTMTPALPEIWAFGLRNPWRYNFDDLGTGATNALFIADVGQGDREEINIEPAGQGGRNYGWRVYEGTLENTRVPALGPAYLPLQSPSFEYTHAVGQAITGGFVYRGSALGVAYRGRYFYADCVQGKIFSLPFTIDGGTGEAVVGPNTDHTTDMGGPFQCVGAFARDPNGELYFMDFGYSASNTGRVFVIEEGGAIAPGVPTSLAASRERQHGEHHLGGAGLGWRADELPPRSRHRAWSHEHHDLPHHDDRPRGGRRAGGPVLRARARHGRRRHERRDERPHDQRRLHAAGGAGHVHGLGREPHGHAQLDVEPGTTQTIIEAGYGPGATALTIPVAAPTAGVAFPGVPPGTYYVRTRGVNACGQGTASVERTLVVQ